MRVDTRADKPTSPSWPKRNLSIIAGIMAGLVLGIGGAFAAQTLDPRLRREEQLRALYRLPVLARIPEESRGRSRERRRPAPALARRRRGLPDAARDAQRAARPRDAAAPAR